MGLLEKYEDTLISQDLRYLKLLAEKFPTIQAASTEIINLEAILTLPKGTEHFVSDVHAEYEAFSHLLRNASGVIRRKIEDVFKNTLRQSVKNTLASLIYYPEEVLVEVLKTETDVEDWYAVTLQRLVEITRAAASKYTRSKVRKSLPPDFAFIIEELLNESPDRQNKEEYFAGIIHSIIRIERAKEFIVAMCKLIQRLSIDRVHVVGDIFDRGPSAEKVLELLLNYHSVDIQWGNHDVLWMGAAAGSKSMIANLLRVSLRYMNVDTIEDGYGINLMPLASFAMRVYQDDPCPQFIPKTPSSHNFSPEDLKLVRIMHKAIAMIQFKLEAEVIRRNPSFGMDDRNLLHLIDYQKGIITIDGKEYELNDTFFPTINPDNPYALSQEEEELMEKLKNSFMNSDRLKRHIKFMYSKGSMYSVYNGNLLYHGCIPLKEDGTFEEVKVEDQLYSGKKLLDQFDLLARKSYFNRNDPGSDHHEQDYMWYLWCGPQSPLFGKTKMATFERYFINDKETHKEGKNPYFKLNDSEQVCDQIITEFGLDTKTAHIINGHVPVKVKKGESPIKAGGKLLVIDGGLSKAYQKETGIAGYTLIFNSYGLMLVAHEPFESVYKTLSADRDILSDITFLEKNASRKRVADTDIGKVLSRQITDLEMLVAAYRKGYLKEIR